MANSRHVCSLPIKDDSGLPKLAPNAHWTKKLARRLKKLIFVNPHHAACKKLFRNDAAILREKRRHIYGPHFFVIHPMSTMDAILEGAFVILWLYLMVMEPLLVFLNKKLRTSFSKCHRKFVSPFQLTLILLFFNRGYIDKKQNRVVLESKQIICRYLFTYFIFDYFSTQMAISVPVTWIRPTRIIANRVKLFAYLIRVLCYGIRIPTVIQFLEGFLKNMKIKGTLRAILCHLIKTYLLLHIISFILLLLPLLYYALLGHDAPPQSWISVTKVLNKHQRVYRKYFETFGIVFCYFFGIPNLIMEICVEQICAVVIAFIGRLYTLYVLADILRVLGIVGVSESLYQGTMSLIEDYMANQGLTESLKQRILKYCKFKFQGRYFQEKRIRNALSNNLRTELFFFTAKQLIQKVELFRSLPRSAIEPIMEAMKSEIFGHNDIIIPIGSEISEVYFISSGTVAVMNSSGTELCHLEDGEVFGTSCLFFKQQKHAIVAVEETEVFTIGKNELMEFLYPFHGIMNAFYHSAREKLEKIKRLEEHVNVSSVNLLTELQGGHILEKPVARLISGDQ